VSVITCRPYREGQLKETGFDTELIDQFIAEEGALVWVDVEDPDQEPRWPTGWDSQVLK
jgi:hypothetical protein